VTKSYQWKDLYREAVLELDSAKLQTKIAVARATIQRRLDEIKAASDAEAMEERHAIADALHNLRTIQTVEFKSLRVNDGTQGQPAA
jgi:hypothetical protein